MLPASLWEVQLMQSDRQLGRLQQLVDEAAATPKTRTPTRPTRGSQRRRVDSKVLRGRLKAGRGRIDE
jgi:ribosome-associated protein